MEHSVDLPAKTFVQAVSPSSPQKILKKIKKVLKVASADGSNMLDINDLDGHLAGFNFSDNSEDEEENEAEVSGGEEMNKEVAAADSIGRALLLVKQVCFNLLLE